VADFKALAGVKESLSDCVEKDAPDVSSDPLAGNLSSLLLSLRTAVQSALAAVLEVTSEPLAPLPLPPSDDSRVTRPEEPEKEDAFNPTDVSLDERKTETKTAGADLSPSRPAAITESEPGRQSLGIPDTKETKVETESVREREGRNPQPRANFHIDSGSFYGKIFGPPPRYAPKTPPDSVPKRETVSDRRSPSPDKTRLNPAKSKCKSSAKKSLLHRAILNSYKKSNPSSPSPRSRSKLSPNLIHTSRKRLKFGDQDSDRPSFGQRMRGLLYFLLNRHRGPFKLFFFR